MSHRHSFLFALLLALAPCAHAQDTIPLPWTQGTKLVYDSMTVDEKVANGVRRTATTRAVSTIEITEAGPDGFVQVWRDSHGSVKLEGDSPDLAAEQAQMRALIARFEGVPIEAQLDARGEFTGVRNWQAVGAVIREALTPAMRAQVRLRAKSDITDADIDARLQPVLANITTQAAIDATVGKNPSIYNLFTAPALAPGKPVRYAAELQSPVSPHRIPAVGQFELVDGEPGSLTVTIRWTQSIDPRKGAEAAWAMVAALTGKPLPADRSELPKQLLLRDEATMVVHRRTGVPISLRHERRLELGGQVKATTWTFKRQAGS